MTPNKTDIQFAIRQLESSYLLATEQFRTWLRFSLAAASLGLLLGMLWVLTAILWPGAIGQYSFLPAAIQSLVQGLAFVQLQQARRQVNAVRVEIATMRRFETALQATHEITDQHLRDKIIALLIQESVCKN